MGIEKQQRLMDVMRNEIRSWTLAYSNAWYNRKVQGDVTYRKAIHARILNEESISHIGN
jgi:hypothetical protein